MALAKVRVRGIALRGEFDDFPGWVEDAIRDSRGQDRLIVEKA